MLAPDIRLGFLLTIARAETLNGAFAVAGLASGEALREAPGDSVDRGAQPLYEAAAQILTPEYDDGIAELRSVAPSKLNRGDRALLGAVRGVADYLRAPPSDIRLEREGASTPPPPAEGDEAAATIALGEAAINRTALAGVAERKPMSLSALNASVGGAALPAEHPRDPSGRSAEELRNSPRSSARSPAKIFTPARTPPGSTAPRRAKAPRCRENRRDRRGARGARPRRARFVDHRRRGRFVDHRQRGRFADRRRHCAALRRNAARTPTSENQSTAGSAAATPAPAAQDGAAANLALAELLTGAHASPAAQQVASASRTRPPQAARSGRP